MGLGCAVDVLARLRATERPDDAQPLAIDHERDDHGARRGRVQQHDICRRLSACPCAGRGRGVTSAEAAARTALAVRPPMGDPSRLRNGGCAGAAAPSPYASVLRACSTLDGGSRGVTIALNVSTSV